MPIYEYRCECGNGVELVQRMGTGVPTCKECGGDMQKKFSPPAILVLKNEGGYPIRSRGYKEGYKKEYLKSKSQEVWRDGIISPKAQG